MGLLGLPMIKPVTSRIGSKIFTFGLGRRRSLSPWFHGLADKTVGKAAEPLVLHLRVPLTVQGIAVIFPSKRVRRRF